MRAPAAAKIGRWACVLLAVLPFLAGCKGFWDVPGTSGGGGGGTTPTTLSSGDFYILDKGTTTSQILGYSIVSGTLTALSASPYPVTGVAYDIAMSPTGSYLYVSSTAGVYIYTINTTTGALTQGAQISQDTIAESIRIDPTGAWLLEALATGALNAIPITSAGAFDNTTGRVEQQVAMVSVQVQQMAIAPNGSLIAVALGSNGTQLFPFTPAATANPIGGALSPTIAVKNTAGAGASVAVAMDPQSRFLYIGETAAFPNAATNSGGLRAFTINSGPLGVTELTTSPYASGGTGPHAIKPNAAGDFVYVASWQGASAGLITPFQVSSAGTVYTLTAQTNTVATGSEPMALAEDNLAHFMLAASSAGNPAFSAYTFDTTTVGKLDLTNTDSTATAPIAIATTP